MSGLPALAWKGPSRRALVQGAVGCAWLSALPSWAQASANRVALVIGNAAYAGAPLPNAANDAKAMSAVLRGMGFEVIELRDAGKQRMEEAIALSRAMLQGRSGVGLLYYAGHGLQLDWRNYLVPVDALMDTAADVPRQAVDIQGAIDAFRTAGNRMNIVVLDACRDNPFGAAASAKGLAPLDAPPGTFLAYATAPGNVAEDGSASDGNGLYTRFLIKELQRPDARIEEVFKRVRLQVRQASQGRQVPWESTSLEDEFVFATGRAVERETDSRRDAAFEAELADWNRIKDSDRAEDFYAFLARYPTGRISEIAQFRLDQLARPAVQAMARADIGALPSGVDRYRVGDAWIYDRDDRVSGRKDRLRARVTAIEGQRVIINFGSVIVDQMGGVIKNRFGTKEPAVMTAPADVQLGKRWRTAFRNRHEGTGTTDNYYDSQVAALEDIEVPAGRFRVFRIESRGDAVGVKSVWRLSRSDWLDPVTMKGVQHKYRSTSADGSKVFDDYTEVLVSLRLVPRT